MIARLSQSGEVEEAARQFEEMVRCGFKPNISCYSSVISALASLQALQDGRSIHGLVLKSGVDMNVFVGCSLIDLYCKCGSSDDGRLVFDALPHKNVVCWNSMVSGYSSNGMISEAMEVFNRMPQRNKVSWNSLIAGHIGVEDFDKAFEVFHRMILCGEQPSKSSFSSVLRACASLASLERGKYAHAKALKLGFQRDIFVDTALLDMYAKSGEITSSVRIFNRMQNKNDVVWTAMIQGLAENGFAEESLQRFEEMGNASSIAPNELIFLSVLFACSHCGLVDKGFAHFNSMERVYGIRPNQRHYTCVVDMLSRAGRLREAEEFIATMPCQPEANAWSALLSGCRTYGDEELGSRASERLAELAEAKPGAYVLLSNSYASGGRWVDAMNTRDVMSRKGIKKSGGCSWMELRNRVHLFYSQDESHDQWREMQWILQLLNTERESYL
ncbi:DNA helicase [Salvia divinorum]|uniref:DNA helicase n=1 Tax=Salvia divinorum TaxID=28513 RepID=A0ABD1FIG1_SALDI